MESFPHPTNEPMTTKKIASTNLKKRPSSSRQPSPYHRLDDLLHTMRCIAQYEDALCELSHELRNAGALSSAATEELRDILEKIPSHDYLVDLDSVRAILAEQRPSKSSSSKKSAKSVTVRKNFSAAPGRSPGGSHRDSKLECELNSSSCRTRQTLAEDEEAGCAPAARTERDGVSVGPL